MRLCRMHYACLCQISRQSDQKHARSGLKTTQNDDYDVITSWHRCVADFFQINRCAFVALLHVCADNQGSHTRNTPSLQPFHPPLYPVQVSRRSVEVSRSLRLQICGGRGGHQMVWSVHFRPLLALWGSGVEARFGWIHYFGPSPPTKSYHITEKPPHMNANPEWWHQIVCALATAGFGDWWVSRSRQPRQAGK